MTAHLSCHTASAFCHTAIDHHPSVLSVRLPSAPKTLKNLSPYFRSKQTKIKKEIEEQGKPSFIHLSRLPFGASAFLVHVNCPAFKAVSCPLPSKCVSLVNSWRNLISAVKMFVIFCLSNLPPFTIGSGLTKNSWTSINGWRFGGFGSPFSSRGNQVTQSSEERYQVTA